MVDLRHMIWTADSPIACTLGAFVTLDWVVLGGYFVLLIGASLWFTRRGQQTTDDYFLAGRRMPAWAAAMSVMATSLSAATFVAVPAFAYRSDLTYLTTYLGLIAATFVVAIVFIPAFYRHNVSTVYQLLEVRFGRSSKLVASVMFMVGRVLASGARLYVAGFAGAVVLGGTMVDGKVDPRMICAAIAVLVVIGIAYTFIGGIEAVVWTDVIQCFVFIGAAVAAVCVLVALIPASPARILDALAHPPHDAPSKLTAIKLGLDGVGPANAFSLVAIALGFSLVGIGSYGADQDLTQRMLTCRDAKAAGRSAIGGVLMSVPVAALFMVAGLLLWVYYQRPDLMGAAAAAPPDDPRRVFVGFIVDHMPTGVGGLMMAGLFAAALSSFNSELNAMSSTLVNDIYRELRPHRDERHYLRVGRAGVVFWGVCLGLFAVVCAYWQAGGHQSMIEFALGVMTYAYSGLVAVFLTALLTDRGSQRSVIAALATGFVVVLLLNFQPWDRPGGFRFDLAWTWQMFVATGIAFVVCCIESTPRNARSKV